jgi:hypothetical protein
MTAALTELLGLMISNRSPPIRNSSGFSFLA